MSTNVSSSVTLVLSIFVPTFWIAFFLITAIALSTLDTLRFGGFSSFGIKAALWLFVLLGFFAFKYTLMRLKRVEMDEDHMYVTNYFKTVRYTYESIEKVVPIDLGIFPLMKVVLKQKGRFGRKVFFIPSKARLLSAIQHYPRSAKAFGSSSI